MQTFYLMGLIYGDKWIPVGWLPWQRAFHTVHSSFAPPALCCHLGAGCVQKEGLWTESFLPWSRILAPLEFSQRISPGTNSSPLVPTGFFPGLWSQTSADLFFFFQVLSSSLSGCSHLSWFLFILTLQSSHHAFHCLVQLLLPLRHLPGIGP